MVLVFLKMWQEARKQEKKLRGMMVDHKKRAERRREYYEHIVRIALNTSVQMINNQPTKNSLFFSGKIQRSSSRSTGARPKSTSTPKLPL